MVERRGSRVREICRGYKKTKNNKSIIKWEILKQKYIKIKNIIKIKIKIKNININKINIKVKNEVEMIN